MNKLTIGVAAVAATLAVPAMAQIGPPDPYGDATVTRADAEKRAGERFAALDTNKDGTLTPEERRAGFGGGFGGGAGGPPPGAGGPPPGGGGFGGPQGPQDKAAYVAAQLARFEQMDGNKDGSLTKAERDAFRQQMIQRFQQGGQ